MRNGFGICAIIGILFFATPVWADCTLTGTLVRVKVLDEARKDVHTLYMRERQSDPHFYSFDTTNELIAGVALSLVAMQTRIEIRGDEFFCPDSGQDRFGGKLLELIANP